MNYVQRSVKSMLLQPSTSARLLFDRQTKWVIGSDADLNGKSTVGWKGQVFCGELVLSVNNSGYVAIRSPVQPLVLFNRLIDLEGYSHLAITAKGSKQWYVNIKTDSVFTSHLFQHRIQLTDELQTILVPLHKFVLTANGSVMKNQLLMDPSKIKTIGFSLVHQPGPFYLEIESIAAVNKP
jgi:hypothetical protein